MFGSFLKKRTSWRCVKLESVVPVSARQERVPGWDQGLLAQACVLIISAGGLGSQLGQALVRKGIGEIHFCDHDIVTPSNLNRQHFLKRSLYKNKAIELCKILRKQGFLGTRLVAHPCRFQDLDVEAIGARVIFCGVDNQFPETRHDVCLWGYENEVPVVFVAVSADADYGYCFVQEPLKACWACVFKPELAEAKTDAQKTCPEVGATIDVLVALAGHALYAIDTLIMHRERDWNYRVISLSRSDFGGSHLVKPREGCVVCGGAAIPALHNS